MPELWLPDSAKDKVAVDHIQQRVLPDQGKRDGGSYFDDELDLESTRQKQLYEEGTRLMKHLQERPDDVVCVGSVEDREQMRTVFNAWFQRGYLVSHPTIRIDYGVPDGSIRII